MPDFKSAHERRSLIEAPTSWSREEIKKVARERIDEISREFELAFKFLELYPKSVTFFGSTMTEEDDKYYKSAKTLAARIAKELHYAIVSGGGPGIMEAANRGAYEAGGESIGLTIELKEGQRTNRYLTSKLDFYYFFVRKMCLSFSAEAFIFYPGGFGTHDEFFELLTLIQTKKIEGVPLICVGSEYWNGVKEMMKTEMFKRNYILPEDMDLFTITDDHDEILNIIRSTPVRVSLPFKKSAVAEVIAA